MASPLRDLAKSGPNGGCHGLGRNRIRLLPDHVTHAARPLRLTPRLWPASQPAGHHTSRLILARGAASADHLYFPSPSPPARLRPPSPTSLLPRVESDRDQAFTATSPKNRPDNTFVAASRARRPWPAPLKSPSRAPQSSRSDHNVLHILCRDTGISRGVFRGSACTVPHWFSPLLRFTLC